MNKAFYNKENNEINFIIITISGIIIKAILQANPFGVDVNSGCKNNLGYKDSNKVKQFVFNAKN